MQKRQSLWNSLVIMLLTVLGTGQAAAQELKILVPRTLSSLPVLELSGQVMEGRMVTVEVFDDHPLAMAALITGKADILMTGFSTGLNRWAASKDVVHALTPVWGVSALVSLDPALKSLKDFAGRSIMVPFAGSPLDIQLKVLLDQAGMTGKVKVEYAPVPQQLPLLLQKKTDAISVPEPLVTRLTAQNGASVVFTYAQAWKDVNRGDPRSPQVSLFVRKNSGISGGSLKALETALSAAITSINQNPGAAAAKHTGVLQVPAGLLEAGLARTLFELPSRADQRRLVETYLEITREVSSLPTGDFYLLP